MEIAAEKASSPPEYRLSPGKALNTEWELVKEYSLEKPRNVWPRRYPVRALYPLISEEQM
jgi:hypothetical protein